MGRVLILQIDDEYCVYLESCYYNRKRFDSLREFFSAMMFAHVEEFEARTLNYMFVKDDKERVVFEKIFGDELMSAQELSEGLSLLWDSKDADEGFGDIFD